MNTPTTTITQDPDANHSTFSSGDALSVLFFSDQFCFLCIFSFFPSCIFSVTLPESAWARPSTLRPRSLRALHRGRYVCQLSSTMERLQFIRHKRANFIFFITYSSQTSSPVESSLPASSPRSVRSYPHSWSPADNVPCV
jgi:hypothetical protein